MSNVHLHYVNDSNGDLVAIDYYHHACLTDDAPDDARLDSPCPEAIDYPVYCKTCGKRIHEVPLTDEGLRARLNDPFIRGYVACALWSSTVNVSDDSSDDTLESLGMSASDLSLDAIRDLEQDCENFMADNKQDLAGLDLEQAGHDFWLTRNGHGAGFWDGDYPHDIGQRLTQAAHVYGESNWDLGDDDQIHIS